VSPIAVRGLFQTKHTEGVQHPVEGEQPGRLAQSRIVVFDTTTKSVRGTTLGVDSNTWYSYSNVAPSFNAGDVLTAMWMAPLAPTAGDLVRPAQATSKAGIAVP
jgi:hypothetical protein